MPAILLLPVALSPRRWLNRRMPDYRRIHADGGTYFLTLCLDDRRSDLLVSGIGHLRASWRAVAEVRPFETVAAVVLPEHAHFIWRLPDDDHDFGEHGAAGLRARAGDRPCVRGGHGAAEGQAFIEGVLRHAQIERAA